MHRKPEPQPVPGGRAGALPEYPQSVCTAQMGCSRQDSNLRDVASKRQAMMSQMPLNVGVRRCFMWNLMETRTCNGCHAAS